MSHPCVIHREFLKLRFLCFANLFYVLKVIGTVHCRFFANVSPVALEAWEQGLSSRSGNYNRFNLKRFWLQRLMPTVCGERPGLRITKARQDLLLSRSCDVCIPATSTPASF